MDHHPACSLYLSKLNLLLNNYDVKDMTNKILKCWLSHAGENEAPEKDDVNVKEGNEVPHKKNKKHRKHKSKKKKKRKKGEKDSSSESGAESDAELTPRPVRTTRARFEEISRTDDSNGELTYLYSVIPLLNCLIMNCPWQ